MQAPKVHKNVQYSKKNCKININGNEGESNIGSDGQSSSTTCSSEDDNVSQETNGVANSDSKASQALNLNGKTRASRGSATDPQSLYARVRNFLPASLTIMISLTERDISKSFCLIVAEKTRED